MHRQGAREGQGVRCEQSDLSGFWDKEPDDDKYVGSPVLTVGNGHGGVLPHIEG